VYPIYYRLRASANNRHVCYHVKGGARRK